MTNEIVAKMRTWVAGSGSERLSLTLGEGRWIVDAIVNGERMRAALRAFVPSYSNPDVMDTHPENFRRAHALLDELERRESKRR